jgi:GT2 family glycosyltransferase
MGGFDEFFFAHQEEIDLCWRMQRAGYKIYVVPSSVVYHVGGGTLAMGSKRKVYLNFRNNLIMLFKNLSFTESIWKIPLRLLLDNITAFKALIKGDFNAFIAIESAHFNFVKWIFNNRNKEIYPKIKMSQLSGVYNGSAVWQYFIKKKKTFYQIIGFKK